VDFCGIKIFRIADGKIVERPSPERRVEHQRGAALESGDRRQARDLRIRHHLRNQICPDPHSSEKVSTAELPPLGAEFLAGVRELYDRELRAQIHGRW
jgi:hypothetical protein